MTSLKSYQMVTFFAFVVTLYNLLKTQSLYRLIGVFSRYFIVKKF